MGFLPLVEGGRGFAHPAYIDNLVDLFVLGAAHPAGANQIFNGVDDEPVTLGEFLTGYMQMIPTKRAIRISARVVKLLARLAAPFSPDLSLRYVADQLCSRGQISNHKARTILGWKPRVALPEGLRRTELWLRSEGYL